MKKYYPVLLVLIVLMSLTAACGPSDEEVHRQQIIEETTSALDIVNDCLTDFYDRESDSWSEKSLETCQRLLLAENLTPATGEVCREWSFNMGFCVGDQTTIPNIVAAYGYNLPGSPYEFALLNMSLTDGSERLYLIVQQVKLYGDNYYYFVDKSGVTEICGDYIECAKRGSTRFEILMDYYNPEAPSFDVIAPTGWVKLLDYDYHPRCPNLTSSGNLFNKYNPKTNYCHYFDN